MTGHVLLATYISPGPGVWLLFFIWCQKYTVIKFSRWGKQNCLIFESSMSSLKKIIKKTIFLEKYTDENKVLVVNHILINHFSTTSENCKIWSLTFGLNVVSWMRTPYRCILGLYIYAMIFLLWLFDTTFRKGKCPAVHGTCINKRQVNFINELHTTLAGTA